MAKEAISEKMAHGPRCLHALGGVCLLASRPVHDVPNWGRGRQSHTIGAAPRGPEGFVAWAVVFFMLEPWWLRPLYSCVSGIGWPEGWDGATRIRLELPWSGACGSGEPPSLEQRRRVCLGLA